MRMNNNDLSWGLGTLVWTTQVHNYAPRLYQCHSNAADRQALFEPYVQYIQWLCRPGEKGREDDFETSGIFTHVYP